MIENSLTCFNSYSLLYGMSLHTGHYLGMNSVKYIVVKVTATSEMHAVLVFGACGQCDDCVR